jgi:cytochrome c5
MLLLAVIAAGIAGGRCSTAQNSAQDTRQASHPASQSAPRPMKTQSGDEGERVFQQNCSRCHNAPEGFSPHISATIVRHMRMRANLSRHDEQELLKYLNP